MTQTWGWNWHNGARKKSALKNVWKRENPHLRNRFYHNKSSVAQHDHNTTTSWLIKKSQPWHNTSERTSSTWLETMRGFANDDPNTSAVPDPPIKRLPHPRNQWGDPGRWPQSCPKLNSWQYITFCECSSEYEPWLYGCEPLVRCVGTTT